MAATKRTVQEKIIWNKVEGGPNPAPKTKNWVPTNSKLGEREEKVIKTIIYIRNTLQGTDAKLQVNIAKADQHSAFS